MPDLRHRYDAPELMDDLSVTDERLTRSLDQLRTVNRWLGGYGAVYGALLPFMQRVGERPVRILDVGTGIGDIPAYLLQETGIRRWNADFTGVDYNPATVEHARRYLTGALDVSVRDRFIVEVADATALPYADSSFDVAMASMFLHHFPAQQAEQIVREMGR